MATNIPQDNFQKTALRLPKELHAALHEAASAAGRSYNNEIVTRLNLSFEQSARGAALADAQMATEKMLLEKLEQAQAEIRRLEAANAKPVQQDLDLGLENVAESIEKMRTEMKARLDVILAKVHVPDDYEMLDPLIAMQVQEDIKSGKLKPGKDGKIRIPRTRKS